MNSTCAPKFSASRWRLSAAGCSCDIVLQVHFTVLRPRYLSHRSRCRAGYCEDLSGDLAVPRCALKTCGVLHWLAGRVSKHIQWRRGLSVQYQSLYVGLVDRWYCDDLLNGSAKRSNLSVQFLRNFNCLSFMPMQRLLRPRPCDSCGRKVTHVPHDPARTSLDWRLDYALGRPPLRIGCSEICMKKLQRQTERDSESWLKEEKRLNIVNANLQLLRNKLSRASSC